MSSQPFDYTVGDFNYIEHADGAQTLRLFMPVGAGPFPLVVDLHGGAWCNGDLKDCEAARPDPGPVRLRCRRTEFPPCRIRLPDLARRHQLCDPLAQGACRQARTARRCGRPVRPEQRRSPRDAFGNAAERQTLHRNRLARAVRRSMRPSRRWSCSGR